MWGERFKGTKRSSVKTKEFVRTAQPSGLCHKDRGVVTKPSNRHVLQRVLRVQ